MHSPKRWLFLLVLILLSTSLLACDAPAEETHFRDEVAPVLEARCGAGVCHGITPSGRAVGEELYDEGFAFYTDEDGNIDDWRQARRESLRFVNAAEAPEFSSLVRKPLPTEFGGQTHAGGDNFASVDDPAMRALIDWIDLEDKGGEDPNPPQLDDGEAFFAERVMPHLVARSCAATTCHGELAFNAYRLDPGMPDGEGGTRFSHQMIRDNYEASRPFLALDGDPTQSRLLKKSLPLDKGGITHRGGNRTFFTDLDDDAAKAVIEWADIERGDAAHDESLRGVVYVEGPPRQASAFDVTTFTPGSDLFLREPAGPYGEVRNLTGHLHDGGADIRDPAVSPDGRRVVFSMRTAEEISHSLYEVDLDDGDVRRLSDCDGTDVMATYGPGGVVYFAADRHGWTDERGDADLAIYALEPDGEDEPRRITFGVGAQLSPAYFDVGEMQGRLLVAHRRTLGAEEETVGFSLRLDFETDYHIYFGITPEEDHFTRFEEMPDGRALTVAADPENRWAGGKLALIDRNLGPDLRADQSPEDVSVPAFAKAYRVLDASTRSSGVSHGGVYRDPVALPDGAILVAWAPGPFDLLDESTPPRFRIMRLALREAPAGCYTLDCLPRIATSETWIEPSRKEHSVHSPRPVVERRLAPLPDSAVDDEATTFELSDATITLAILDDIFPDGGLYFRDDIRSVRFLEATPERVEAQRDDRTLGEHLPTRILGDVALKDDGSAYVEIPPETPFRTQLLDEDGMAVDPQHNRWLFAWPGQTFPKSVDRHRYDAACGGCHGAQSGRPGDIPESIDTLTGATPTLATFEDRNPRRPREATTLDEDTGREVVFTTDIQPILDRRCATAGCHAAESAPAAGIALDADPGAEFSASYEALMAMGEGSGGGRKYVDALPGPVDRPRHEVAVIDVEDRAVTDRFRVGRAPVALAIHPAGHHLAVANRMSNYLSVIDLRSGTSTRHEVDFYTEGLLFDARGEHLYLTNRWKDAVQALQVRRRTTGLELTPPDDPSTHREIPVDFSPQRMALSADERTLYVASPQALTVSAVDTTHLGVAHQPLTSTTPVEVDDDATSEPPAFADEEVAPGVERIWIGAPPFGVATTDDRIFVATLSESTHHPAGVDDDAHDYMPPSQGSPNRGFPALQNEIAAFSKTDLQPTERYTSTDYCCPDVRDVSPDDPARGHLVPDASLRIVDGALPTAIASYGAPGDTSLLVAYGGSNEVQRFDVGDDGILAPGPTTSVGFDPRSVQIYEGRREAYVINRLGESVSVIDLDAFEVVDEIPIAADAPDFPATDAELGELVFFSGADFSVDGGQTCNHCHFDRGNIGKFFSIPFLADQRGSRMTMDVRGLYDTRPWLMEGVADEDDVFEEFLEMAHADNFCCEAAEDPDRCAAERPPPCDEEPYAGRAATRDAFVVEVADELVSRQHSFGGAVDTRLDFEGINRLVGLFLIHEPGLLPNPNPLDTLGTERGRLLFESPTTGCSVCHPAPTFGVSSSVNPFDVPLVVGPVVDPVVHEASNKNLDLLSTEFLERFPQAVQTSGDVHLKSTSLRGLWDRAPGFYHDGRARTLRRALVVPGHPALDADEDGYNVADGVIDSHGGTSHLTEGEVEDLVEFLEGL